jgi:hypothetical protein
MINDYIIKLVDNLPDNIKNTNNPIEIDLVLGGGAFSGSYQVGALFLLKEMEKRRYIKIKRISGCSIGSILGLLYFIDELSIFYEAYNLFADSFKKTRNLSIIKKLDKILGDKLPKNVTDIINNKLFISYNNVLTFKKIIKCKYKNACHLYDVITKSCYIPYLIDGDIVYKNKYVDGITPYFFNDIKNRQLLFLNLFTINKLCDVISIKNEKTNIHRILSGMLDIHTFFIKQSNTQMCSYVNDWKIINKIHNYIKLKVEKINFYIICFLLFIKKHLPLEYSENLITKMLLGIGEEAYHTLVGSFCV